MRTATGYSPFASKEETVSELDGIVAKTGRSRNELIAMFIEYGLRNCEIID